MTSVDEHEHGIFYTFYDAIEKSLTIRRPYITCHRSCRFLITQLCEGALTCDIYWLPASSLQNTNTKQS